MKSQQTNYQTKVEKIEVNPNVVESYLVSLKSNNEINDKIIQIEDKQHKLLILNSFMMFTATTLYGLAKIGPHTLDTGKKEIVISRYFWGLSMVGWTVYLKYQIDKLYLQHEQEINSS